MESPLSVYREPSSYASKSARQYFCAFLLWNALCAEFLTAPSAGSCHPFAGSFRGDSEPLAASMPWLLTRQRGSYMAPQAYLSACATISCLPAGRCAEVSLSSSPVSWPAKQCWCLLRPSPGESLAPFEGLGALARRLFLSARMRFSSESLICNFQGS